MLHYCPRAAEAGAPIRFDLVVVNIESIRAIPASYTIPRRDRLRKYMRDEALRRTSR
jgi:hypothetical protein